MSQAPESVDHEMSANPVEGKDNKPAFQEEGIEDCEDDSEGPPGGNAEQGTVFKSSFLALNQM